MLDIKRIVEDRENVKKALLKRMTHDDLDLDSLIKVYDEFKGKLAEFEKKRSEQNKFNEEMAKLEKGSEKFVKMVSALKAISSEVKALDKESAELKEKLDNMLAALPNIPDDEVAAGGKENNKVVREWGDKPEFGFEIKDHLTLGENLGILDFGRASKIGGAQMSMYLGDGARLVWALVKYFMDFHEEDGYTCVIPPHLVNEQSAYTAGQLPKFKDDVYWTQDGQCLVPTAETALSNLHRDETLAEDDLPKKYYSYTPCYRREAGSYGSEERGLKRMHQFHKVEMFQYTTPETSGGAIDELVGRAETLVKGLGLAHRVSLLAADDMSFGMARTYDVEVYLPFEKGWTEVSSISNARDFQARRGNMKYKTKDGEVRIMHTLNASGLATPRVIIALLETYQQKDGTIKVPEVLQEYMGKDTITARV